MLIYDHNKEFVGIDEESLELLGYSRFDDLLHEHKDVAELFVKKPGYIHNFTNFPWIDFILHAESEEAKVIIAGKSKAFSATIDIQKLHLTKAPDEEAYLVRLKNVQNYQLDASERPVPTPPPFDLEAKSFNAPQETPKAAAQPVAEEEPQAEQPPLTLDEDLFIKEEPVVEEETGMPVSPSKTLDDEELDIFFDDEEESPAEQEPELPPLPKSVLDNLKEEKSTPMLGAHLSEEDKAYLKDLEFSDDYLYDPQIAADELGLPVDLIEEFIGDFIKQAHEFKEQLFNAIKNEDFDTIKVLSHKLKGVAANLRIEDSFEVLRNVNESVDVKECEANLKKFYLTVAKLEGKDIEEVRFELEKQEKEEELYDLTPKFNEPNAEEETLPPLDLPELEPQEEQTPVMQEHITEPSVVKAEQDETSDIYDFGLNQEDADEPLIFMDDEEEAVSDLQDFEPLTEDKENLPLLSFDINRAAAEIGLSADLVTALIDDYIVEANEMKKKLTEAVEADDAVRWKGYATQLKGVSDNLRIKDISETLQKLTNSTDKIQAKAVIQEFYGFINQL